MEQKQHYYKVWCRGYDYHNGEDFPGTMRANSAAEAASFYDNVYHVTQLLTPKERKELSQNGEE